MDSQKIKQTVDSQQASFEAVSDQIWTFAEIGYQEFLSADLLCRTLAEHGFRVTRPLADIKTAFMGEYGSGSPVIAFLGEFDALPNLSQKANLTRQEPAVENGCGHGCGHHILGTGSLEAACAVKELIASGELQGTVRFYGCPAEEGGAGKAFMVRAGVFDDVDLCLTWHPSDCNGVMQGSLANIRMFFEFHGKSAHAAAQPHMGRSALDAVELTNVGCNYLREHVIPQARIHYAITNSGGPAPNVVQAYAEELYCVRAPRQFQVKEIYERVCDVARGAALMTGTTVNIRVSSAYADTLPNPTLFELVQAQFDKFCPIGYSEEELAYARQYMAEGRPAPVNTAVRKDPITFGASTDVGDVSWVVPTVSLETACFAAGTALHSWKATAQGQSSIAKKGMHLAAKVMAAAAAELYQNEELRERAKADFRDALGTHTYQSLIPDDIKPEMV